MTIVNLTYKILSFIIYQKHLLIKLFKAFSKDIAFQLASKKTHNFWQKQEVIPRSHKIRLLLNSTKFKLKSLLCLMYIHTSRDIYR